MGEGLCFMLMTQCCWLIQKALTTSLHFSVAYLRDIYVVFMSSSYTEINVARQ